MLAGARDQRQPGLCLFPETLRSELHGIRAVVEAYSRTRQIEGRDEADANGLAAGSSGGAHRIRVTDAAGTDCYRIDRWDCSCPIPPRCVHYVGVRDDRYWNAYWVFGGQRFIHRRWDARARRDIGPDDVVVFATGDELQPVAERNGDNLDEAG